MINVPAILLLMTAISGMVDAVSFLALGHVFIANMTGNVVLLGFALGGAPGLSVSRSFLALICFMFGAILGGRMVRNMNPQDPGLTPAYALIIETVVFFAVAGVSIGFSVPYENHSLKLSAIIVLTAIGMGLRNAVVRKLGIADLTTTVLTLTITGLAADSRLAGGDDLRWKRRGAAVLAIVAGGAAGAWLLNYSAALPLLVCGLMCAICALARIHVHLNRSISK